MADELFKSRVAAEMDAKTRQRFVDHDAQDELAALRAENARLREFAEAVKQAVKLYHDGPAGEAFAGGDLADDLDAALAALRDGGKMEG